MFFNNINRRVSAPSVLNSSPIVASQMRSSNDRAKKRKRHDDDDADATQNEESQVRAFISCC
jgi:hypothetical protein